MSESETFSLTRFPTEKLTCYQIAYAALWWMQSDTPAFHEARKAALNVIGGKGSQGQKEALSWAIDKFGDPMNLDPHMVHVMWDETDY